MKKLAVALVAFVFAAPVFAAPQDIAPPVKRKPVATAAAPAAPQPGAATPMAPQPAARTMNESGIAAALAAAAGQGGDAALDNSLVRVMTRLVVAGRCGEAASLAARDGRKELAARAQQLCK